MDTRTTGQNYENKTYRPKDLWKQDLQNKGPMETRPTGQKTY